MPDLTLDDRLILLIEECGEVIQAATKCLRFGFNSSHVPAYGINHEVLARECGDLLAVIEALPLTSTIMQASRHTKMDRARIAKQDYGRSLGSSA